MTARDRFRELVAGFHLGDLEPGERAELEALMADASAEELRLFAELDDALVLVAASAPPVDPPDDLRERIVARLGRRESLRPDVLSRLAGRLGLGRPRRALAAVAALALLLVGAALLGGLLHRRAVRAESRIVELEGRLDRYEQFLDVLRSRQADLAVLRGGEAEPEPHGKVLWDAASGTGVLQLANLPPTPPGTVYQLWVYPRYGDPWSAGVFEIREPGAGGLFGLENFTAGARSELKGFLITLEEGEASEPGEERLLGVRLE